MLNYIEVIKVKKNTGEELDINLKLDLERRNILSSDISIDDFNKLFNVKHRFDYSDIQPQNLILY